MEFRWKGLRLHLDENSQGAQKVTKMAAEALGKPAKSTSFIYAFLCSSLLSEPKPAAELQVPEDKNGEVITELVELYLVTKYLTLEQFFRALDTATGIPENMLSWLIDASQMYVKLCGSKSGGIEMYGFARDQAERKELLEMYADELEKDKLRAGFPRVLELMETAKGFLEVHPNDFFIDASGPLAAEPVSVGDEALTLEQVGTRYWWEVKELPSHLVNEGVKKAFSNSGVKNPQLPEATYVLDLMKESDVMLEPVEQLAKYTLAVDKLWRPISMQGELYLSLQLNLDEFFNHVKTAPGLSKKARKAILAAKNWANKIYENQDIGFVQYCFVTEADLARFPIPDTPDFREVYRLTMLATVEIMRANVASYQEERDTR